MRFGVCTGCGEIRLLDERDTTDSPFGEHWVRHDKTQDPMWLDEDECNTERKRVERQRKKKL
jgi:hypothetical protein